MRPLDAVSANEPVLTGEQPKDTHPPELFKETHPHSGFAHPVHEPSGTPQPASCPELPAQGLSKAEEATLPSANKRLDQDAIKGANSVGLHSFWARYAKGIQGLHCPKTFFRAVLAPDFPRFLLFLMCGRGSHAQYVRYTTVGGWKVEESAESEKERDSMAQFVIETLVRLLDAETRTGKEAEVVSLCEEWCDYQG